MDNTRIYELVRTVPENAKKMIEGGRLKGMTDINSMWRIKTLTELFGPAGIGWYVRQTQTRVLDCAKLGESIVIVEVELVYRETPDSDWSAPVFGTGGSKLAVVEKNGLHFDDEALKKAYTDAIGVCCKALGIGADVYWDKDSTKYDGKDDGKQNEKSEPRPVTADSLRADLIAYATERGMDVANLRIRAEAYIEKADKKFTEFDKMTILQLRKVEKKIKDADQAT
jgi:hypothetical protein